MARRRKWSEEDRAKLSRLLAAGATCSEAAKQLDRSKSAISNRAFKDGHNTYARLWPAATLQHIRKSLDEGLGYHEIAKVIGKTQPQVSQKCSRLGWYTKRGLGFLEQKKLAKQGKRRCRYCNKILPITQFQPRKGQSYCRACERTQAKNRAHGSSSAQMNQLFIVIKSRCKRKKLKFNINVDYLRTLWDKQSGKCHYSAVPMTYTHDNSRSTLAETHVTVDRIKPNVGYVKGNLVLCCWAVNRMKSDMTVPALCEWCKRILA